MSLIWVWGGFFFSPLFYLEKGGWVFFLFFSFLFLLCSDWPFRIIFCAHVLLCMFGSFPTCIVQAKSLQFEILLKADCFFLWICKPVRKKQYPFRAVVKRGWCLTNALYCCWAKLLHKCIVEGTWQGLLRFLCWPQYLLLS